MRRCSLLKLALGVLLVGTACGDNVVVRKPTPPPPVDAPAAP